jgi:hypothetical protein
MEGGIFQPEVVLQHCCEGRKKEKLPHQKQHHEKYKHALKKFLGICSLYARD